ncbi:MAG: transposase [bacterium]
MAFQSWLIPPEELTQDRLQRYTSLFSQLNTQPIRDSVSIVGRPPLSRPSLLRALIYKNIRCFPSLTELVIELKENPLIAERCGFDLWSNLPNVERFSAFLRDTPNYLFQEIRSNLVFQLVELEEISGKYLVTDSCPIKANVKENNPKTVIKDRFDKTKYPKGDKDSRLGVIVTFPTPSKKKIEYFWGYRNHVISDAISELPVAEITKPANVSEVSLFIPQCRRLQEIFHFPINAVAADSLLDSATIIEFIVKELKAKPVIAKNPRASNRTDITLSLKGIPICIAGFHMLSRGKFKDKKQNRIRHKFVCPIKGSKKFAKEQPYCPWWHPKFINGNGCITYLRVDVDESIRRTIDYGSEEFKKIYNLRTGAERIFSRLLAISMQEPTVKGLNATANICTIAHITVLSVALTAVRSDQVDKIRFVKSLIPNL